MDLGKIVSFLPHMLIVVLVCLGFLQAGKLGKATPNEFFSVVETYAMRGAVSLIFLVGLYKVVKDTIEKILK